MSDPRHVVAPCLQLPGRCGYTDQIDIQAGILTPPIWLFAHIFYRYRQRRWRHLVRAL